MNSPNGEHITLRYSPGLRQRWPRPLADEWALAYPQIFDADDLRQTVLQPLGHFYEWFVALHLYESQGALSLIEKYCYGNHARKVEFLDRFLSAEQCAFLRNFRALYRVQPPDLFVYMPGTNRFWFAEVKGGRDRLRPEQRDSHAALTEKLGVPVQMFYVRPG
jgi:VRR-NUC domain